MKQINYSNILSIKVSLQDFLMDKKVYEQMISFQALEFRRYIYAWLENTDLSWEEFSVRDNSFQSLDQEQSLDTSVLASISESFYYKDYDRQKVFNLLKDLNQLEKKIKSIEEEMKSNHSSNFNKKAG